MSKLINGEETWEEDAYLDDTTPIPCLACDGQFKTIKSSLDGNYIIVRCRWCIGGVMTQSQIDKWNNYRKDKS